MKLVNTIWNRWKKVGHFVADLISRVILTLCYIVLILPVGLIYRFTSDPLSVKKKTGWTKFRQNAKSLEQVKDQF